MAIWKAVFRIKPVGKEITGFRGMIKFDNYTLRFDEKKKKNKDIICEVIKEFDTEDCSRAREYIARDVKENLLPLLTLSMNCGFEFDPNSMSLIPEKKGTGILITERIIIRSTIVIVIWKNSNTIKEELNNFKDRFEKLNGERRRWFLRAISFLNRGLVDTDPINKFINTYISLEILAKRVLNIKGSHYDVSRYIEEIYKSRCGVELKYGGYYVNTIRNALLHGESKVGDKKLVGDEVIELIRIYINKFVRNVLTLAKCILEG